MTYLRWLLVPVVLGVSFGALFLGCLLVLGFFDLFCPESQRSSDVCVAPWFTWVERTLFVGAQVLYGFLWVLLGSLVAPVRSRGAAPVLLLAGVLTVGISSGAWWGVTMALAVTGGVLALAVLLWRSPRP